MNDKEREGLSGAFAFFTRAAMHGYNLKWSEASEGSVMRFTLSLTVNREGEWPFPDLDTGQIMGLNTLVQDASQLPQALADYLLDLGVQPAPVGEVVFKEPVYDESENRYTARSRIRQTNTLHILGEHQRSFLNLCRRALGGRGDPAMGKAYNLFVDKWVGYRRPVDMADVRSCWPTSPFITERLRHFPKVLPILRHMRTTATERTTGLIDRVIAHVEEQERQSLFTEGV